jgi:hypothetical protein
MFHNHAILREGMNQAEPAIGVIADDSNMGRITLESH